MARLPRISPAGVPVHLIQRGNNRHICFGMQADFSAYMGWLKEYSVKFDVDIHAWVLMTNHVHLLCTPKQDGAVSQMMQSVGLYQVSFRLNQAGFVTTFPKRTTTLILAIKILHIPTAN